MIFVVRRIPVNKQYYLIRQNFEFNEDETETPLIESNMLCSPYLERVFQKKIFLKQYFQNNIFEANFVKMRSVSLVFCNKTREKLDQGRVFFGVNLGA